MWSIGRVSFEYRSLSRSKGHLDCCVIMQVSRNEAIWSGEEASACLCVLLPTGQQLLPTGKLSHMSLAVAKVANLFQIVSNHAYQDD